MPLPPRPNIVTAEYKSIEDEINRIQGLIDGIVPVVASNKALVDDDDRLINQVYIPKLTELEAKLKNVTDNHQSSYDSLAGQLATLQSQILSCNDPKADKSLKPNKQNSQNLLNDILTVQIPGIEKTHKDLTTIISNFEASYNEYDKAIVGPLGYQGKIIKLGADIVAINIDISGLIVAKDANQTNIDKSNEKIRDLNKQINDLIIKDYSNKVYNNKNILNLSEYTDTSLNYLFSYLKNQALSSDVIYEKIEHRDNEHEKLSATNKVFDIIFYCFYFSFFLIMICTGNIKREHFLIYLFVGLIPFIYPFIFKFIMYLIKYISNDPHGPKNGFVDINNTIIAYND